eukprot:3690981-Pleurochrysis_carterae.AAC.1
MYNASGLTDCSFDFAVFSRSDCKLQSKIDGATGAPKLETNFGYPASVDRTSTAEPVTYSSWNVPMLGPTAADAMNETLLSDDGTGPEAQISLYKTNDYTTPHNVSAGFATYTAGDFSSSVYNAYTDVYQGTAFPWFGKHIGPSSITHPEDSNIVLSRETGDFTAAAVQSGSVGVVFRFTVPINGTWELHDSFVMPIGSRLIALNVSVKTGGSTATVVPRETWQGRASVDVAAYVASYADSRPLIRPLGAGVSLGALQAGDEVCLAVDNYDGW